jgi:hypothetical protein
MTAYLLQPYIKEGSTLTAADLLGRPSGNPEEFSQLAGIPPAADGYEVVMRKQLERRRDG